MIEQKERTRITQSGKNCVMYCAIQGVHLIWRQKIRFAISEFLFRDFPVNQFNFKFLHSISTFCTQFQVFALFGINWHALSQSEWRNFFMYIITSVTIVANWSGSLIVLSKRSTWVKTLETKRWSLLNELWLDWRAQKILYLLISFLINVLFYSRHLNHNVVLSQHSPSRFYRSTETPELNEYVWTFATFGLAYSTQI